MFNSLDDLTRCNQENMDTAMKSLEVISKNMQALAVGAADYSKRSIEQGTVALEKMLGADSIETAMEVQSDYFKTAYESFIAESNRVSELYADLAKEVYRPFETYVGNMPTPPDYMQASS